MSFLWDIRTQYSPRYDPADGAVPSGAIMLAKRIFIEKWISKSLMIPLKMTMTGLTQIIMMRESICH